MTVVVGASDKGKSSLLRALGCVAVGEPDGAELIRHDAPGYAVQLVLPDCTVVRKRGKSGNVFVLDGVTYTRDRGDWPPARVLDKVRLCPQNFQWQLDGPLWFLDSAGTVAKQLNKVVDLEAIDAVLGAANTLAKQAVNAEEGAKAEYESAKHAYRSLKWVPAMCASWERLKERSTAVDKTSRQKERLGDVIRKLQVASKPKYPDELFKAFATLERVGGALEVCQARRENLATVIRRATKLQGRINAVDAVSLPFAALAGVRADAERTGREMANLATAIDSLESLQAQETRCRKELDEAKAELSKVATCPACGQPVRTGSPSSAPIYTSATARHRHD